jgi:hypothetical protein
VKSVDATGTLAATLTIEYPAIQANFTKTQKPMSKHAFIYRRFILDASAACRKKNLKRTQDIDNRKRTIETNNLAAE